MDFRYSGGMTSKQRVRAAFAHEIPDRVPINYMCNPGIDAKLKNYFNIDKRDDEGLRQALGIDFRVLNVKYVGPKIHADIENRKVDPLYGYRMKWVPNESSGYWEYCDFPLREASIDEVKKWPLPNPDDFDYTQLDDLCEEYKDHGIVIGNNGNGLVMCRASFFRGFDQVLIDLALDDEAGLLLIDRFLEFQYQQMKRILKRIGTKVDVMWMGEDLGTQTGPLISMDLFKKHILSRQKRFIDLAGAYDIPCMIHTCGSSSWAYEQYIKSGMKAVDTLQPEATDMSPEYLKKTFGERLTLHGCISTAGDLTYGNIQDVRDVVKKTLEVMMPGGGYCLAPTHRIQDNTPLENALEMYKAAHKYGRY